LQIDESFKTIKSNKKHGYNLTKGPDMLWFL